MSECDRCICVCNEYKHETQLTANAVTVTNCLQTMLLLMLQLMPLQPDIETQRAVDLAALRGAARMTQQPLPSPRAGFFLFAGL